jgi:hypothetical protein
VVIQNPRRAWNAVDDFGGQQQRPRVSAVVQSCGHYSEGKAAPDYQRACIGLARKGFVARLSAMTKSWP